jgi:hypothetical protein
MASVALDYEQLSDTELAALIVRRDASAVRLITRRNNQRLYRAAWSILNKVNHRADGRFSDVALIVCPNVTIRDRLRELDPELGEASLYRTRDLVPPHLMPLLTQGRVLVTNWHVFEPQAVNVAGTSAKVTRTGVEAVLFYLVAYLFMNLGAFAIVAFH